MTRRILAAAVKPLLLILTMAMLAACGQSQGLAPLPGAPIATRTRTPAPYYDVPEGAFVQPGEALADGPVTNLRSYYGGVSDRSLNVCRLEQGRLLCHRHSAQVEVDEPALVQVSGQVSSAELAVDAWQPLDWDENAQRALAQAELEAKAGLLADYDWSGIARSDYADSSGWFRGDEERFKTLPLSLFAYDSASNRVVWRAEGWALPQQQHLVHRFPVVYIVTDPAGKLPPETYFTIEGYVEE